MSADQSADQKLASPSLDLVSRIAPELSAKSGLVAWQAGALLLALTVLSLILVAPVSSRPVALVLVATAFIPVLAVRIFALADLFRRRPDCTAPPRGIMTFPTITVLVPLFKEANVVTQLVAAMSALNYPAGRIELLFLVEACDEDTFLALERAALPDHMRIIVVPAGLPRTKPRALNFGLALARGELVSIFDAEDIPEPDQLKQAAHMFGAASASDLACVQARLNIYNPSNTFLTRHFTIEYTVLFDAILPALVRLGLPVPLGGTSNHFRRSVLEDVAGWDAYNVTEDADLGIRLARLGYRVDVIASTTWEEAPPAYALWRGQRTRWLKGWLQTYIVHMRQPGRTWRELGPRAFLGLQFLMGGVLLSSLIHPWFYVMLCIDAWHGNVFSLSGSIGSQSMTIVAWSVFAAGYLSAVALAMVSVLKRGWLRLIPYCLLAPVYWLLVSLAAYRAIFEYARKPFHWQKTTHVGRECERRARADGTHHASGRSGR